MKVLVSACLLGECCRYDATAKYHAELVDALASFEVVSLCPEIEGGLSCPRLPSEIAPDGRVVDASGADVSVAFERGAHAALEAARREACAWAVLKAKSPSCGTGEIYDGTFSGTLRPGCGVTARLLANEQVRVFDENGFLEHMRENAHA